MSPPPHPQDSTGDDVSEELRAMAMAMNWRLKRQLNQEQIDRVKERSQFQDELTYISKKRDQLLRANEDLIEENESLQSELRKYKFAV
jgi:hypothetical protein